VALRPRLAVAATAARRGDRVAAVARLGEGVRPEAEPGVGVDDLILEAVAAGATGWIAGLVNALPEESVELFDLAMQGKGTAARKLYEWFLPLLRLDTVPKFVQLIKLAQQEAGMGSERVRPPRLTLAGEERERALATIREGLGSRPGRG